MTGQYRVRPGMALTFHKMHGAGNDFILLDLRQRKFELDADRARLLADRRLGIGCDQILVLQLARDEGFPARYEIWNADGSPAGQCGNGARCIGLYLAMNGEVNTSPFKLESPSGVIELQRQSDGQFEVDMGRPSFTPESIPLSLNSDGLLYRLESPSGPLEFGAVSMGNPHALVIVDEIGRAPVEAHGAFLNSHDCFPDGVNTGFAQIENRGKIRLRVYERGSGETLACGTGACAAVAILKRLGRVGEVVDVFLPGGHLVIKWPAEDRPIRMKGPAVHVFRGTLNE